MSNTLVAIFFGIGAGGWVYYQMMRRTGSNAKTSWTSAILAGIVAAFVMYSLFAWVFTSE